MKNNKAATFRRGKVREMKDNADDKKELIVVKVKP